MFKKRIYCENFIEMKWGKLLLFLKKSSFLRNISTVDILASWWDINIKLRSLKLNKQPCRRFFYSFFILRIRLVTKSKVRNTIFLKKRICFQKLSVLEKKVSLVSISQIENYEKKSSTRVTSEVRKCPKTHFCRFWFSRNSVFCDLRKN